MFLNEERKMLKYLSEYEQLIIFKGFIAGNIEVFGLGAWGHPDRHSLCKESIYRVPPRKTKIDWSFINTDFKFYARDKNSCAWFYDKKPKICGREWYLPDGGKAKFNYLLSGKVIQIGDEPWQESLIERPEGE